MIRDDILERDEREIGKPAEILRLLLQITKFPLSFHVAFSAITGYLIYSARMDLKGAFVFTGVFILASGSAVLNNVQDRFYDKRLLRTKDRAIPSGKLSVSPALVVSVSLIASGLFLIYQFFGFKVATIGAVSVLFYNGIYTVLKKKTSFGILPGAACGMLPPLIGWISAGGDLYSIKIFHIMTVFGVWQIPHYFLILLKNREDYVKSEYPVVMNLYPLNLFIMVTVLWTVSFNIVIFLLPLSGTFRTKEGWIYVLVNLFLLMTFNIYLILKRDFKLSFNIINGSVTLFMCALISEAFLR